MGSPLGPTLANPFLVNYEKFFRYMNSRHPNINFTCEEENDNKISFLDISITRTENKFTTSAFCKERFSGVYLNFHSHLPTDYKKGFFPSGNLVLKICVAEKLFSIIFH